MKGALRFFDLLLVQGFFCLSCLLSPARADVVITTNDDMIVQAKCAVGMDTMNNEVFGDDTMRLKENNLRLWFLDTSGAGLPDNDWEFTLNDSANGGDSYAAIADVSGGAQVFRVTAAAPSNALRVTASGNVGVGVASPQAAVHLSGAAPAARHDANSQAWETRASGTGFGFVDVSHGSSVPMRVEANSVTDAAFLTSGGRLGVGTSSPSSTVHVAGNAVAAGGLEFGSSRTFKEDISPVSPDAAGRVVDALRPVRFRYKGEEESQLGFIAEEMPPGLAAGETHRLRPMDLIAVLLSAAKELEEAEADLRARVEQQHAAIADLRKRLHAAHAPVFLPEPDPMKIEGMEP